MKAIQSHREDAKGKSCSLPALFQTCLMVWITVTRDATVPSLLIEKYSHCLLLSISSLAPRELEQHDS